MKLEISLKKAALFTTALCLGLSCASKKVETAEATPAPAAPATAVITRTFEAPVDKVWAAWTQSSKIKRWWGPRQYSAPVVKIDFKEGGKYLFSMKGPDGKVIYSGGKFLDIEPKKSFEAEDYFADAKGRIVPPSHYGMPADMPERQTFRVTFEEVGKNQTKMTLVNGNPPVGKMGEMQQAGWNESFDKLAESLR